MKLEAWRLRRVGSFGKAPWRSLEHAWSIPAESARLAWMRGIDAPEDLAWRLDPSWDRTWDPYLLAGMDRAVARIRRAVEQGEPIWVYGDYDVDGVTATALLFRVIERLGGKVRHFIPNRFSDGYGLHLDCIREIGAPGSLMISVDCGVRSTAEVEASRELGIEWVITDHHALGEELPRACAVIHPALGDHPNRDLAGVGVAFKLAQSLLDAVPVPKGGDVPFLDGLLKLVALGTLADMVPLAGENALLVKRGLRAMAGTNGPGLACLLKAARIDGEPGGQQIVFGVVPRLNAVGRMGGAEDAVQLLLTRDAKEAAALAANVERLNLERRATQKQLLQRLPSHDGSAFDFVLDRDAHKGVIGIVASQRMRDTGVPTAVCTVLDGVAHASLRAPGGYDLNVLLERARPYLLSGGGHKAAAGMSFELSRLDFVRNTLVRGAAEQAQTRIAPAVELDGRSPEAIPSFADLRALEPFGPGFPEPVVGIEGVLAAGMQSFGDGHRKFRLGEQNLDMVWFSGDDAASGVGAGDFLRVAASPQDHPRWGRSWRVNAALGDSQDLEGAP
ncbi:MAG TPA: DHH family phosphoesterase [Holophaga sp.]|nr:DHH family phosphoesterase [Holophaga sp.]